MEKGVPQRALAISLVERAAAARPLGEAIDHAGALAPQHELELAKLIRLKTARRLEALAKRQELERRHRLEDVELRDEHLQDGEDPPQRVLRPVRLAFLEQAPDEVHLVEQLLEPELVHLVNDDEEELVVLGTRGSRLLQREKGIDLQVGGVGDGRIARHCRSRLHDRLTRERTECQVPSGTRHSGRSSVGRYFTYQCAEIENRGPAGSNPSNIVFAH